MIESGLSRIWWSQEVIWSTSKIKSLASEGLFTDARRLFDSMLERSDVTWNIMIAAYAPKGHLQEQDERQEQQYHQESALELFNKMPAWCTISWNTIIAVAGQSGDPSLAHYLFDIMPEKNVTSWNSVVAAYAKRGYVFKARSLFQSMNQRNAISWNTLVTAYAQNGYTSEATGAFDRMPQWTLLSWTALLQGYAQAGQLKQAQSLFDALPDRDLICWNSMITGYAQNGYLDEAKAVFDEMQTRNVVSWNAILQACTELGLVHQAASVFERMPQWTGHSWNQMITGYGQAGKLQLAEELFDQMPAWDVIAWTALMTAYAQNGATVEARNVFDRMPVRDSAAWNAMVSAYAQEGELQQCFHLFLLMDLDGVRVGKATLANILSCCDSLKYCRLLHSSISGDELELESVVIAALVTAYGKLGSIDDAQKLLDGSVACNNCWSAMVASYVQNNYPVEAFQLWRQLNLSGLRPNKYAFFNLLEACSMLGDVSKGREIHAAVVESGFTVDGGATTLGTALATMYGRCGSLEEAWRIFEAVPQPSALSGRDIVSWNAMIIVCAQNKGGDKVLNLFRTMVLEGVQPNSITFITVIFACSHAGMTVDGTHLFTSIVDDYELVPNRDHYMCMLDLLARAGLLNEVEELIDRMPVVPDVVAWKTLLSACRVHSDHGRGGSAAEQVSELDPQTAAPYLLLSNIYTHHDKAKVNYSKK